jgi:putative ABC transport system substrate-binding protein
LGAAMRRRAFVEGIAALGVAWPLTVRAQQPAMPVVGFLSIGSPESDAVRLTGLRRGLNESGLLAQSGHRTPSGTL